MSVLLLFFNSSCTYQSIRFEELQLHPARPFEYKARGEVARLKKKTGGDEVEGCRVRGREKTHTHNTSRNSRRSSGVIECLQN